MFHAVTSRMSAMGGKRTYSANVLSEWNADITEAKLRIWRECQGHRFAPVDAHSHPERAGA